MGVRPPAQAAPADSTAAAAAAAERKDGGDDVPVVSAAGGGGAADKAKAEGKPPSGELRDHHPTNITSVRLVMGCPNAGACVEIVKKKAPLEQPKFYPITN